MKNPATTANRGSKDSNSNGEDIISFAALDQIDIRNSSNGKHQGIPLSTWLERTRKKAHCMPSFSPQKVVAEDATLKKSLHMVKQQDEQLPRTISHQQQQEENHHLSKENLKERLRIAVAITKALSDLHSGGRCAFGQRLTLDNIILDICGGYCNASLIIMEDGNENNIPSVKRTNEEDMKQQLDNLGRVLNIIFGGEPYNNNVRTRLLELEPEPRKRENKDHHATKKRGKNRPATVDSKLPLYLVYLISSLLISPSSVDNPGGGGTIHHYECLKQVLQDLQIAAAKPEIYLQSYSYHVDKSIRIPKDLFYGRKSELALVLHSLDTVLKFGQPVLCTVSGYAGTGKTALLNQIKRPLTEAKGFMIRCKFDKATPSNAVIFSAINSFFEEINIKEDEAVKSQLKGRITDSMGFCVGVLMSAIPNLRAFMEDGIDRGNEEPVDEYQIEETTVSHFRWKFLLRKLINAISDKTSPLAFFMDDLHWCDEVTIDTIQMIVMDPDLRHCLFLGTYRPVESSLPETIDIIQSNGVFVVKLKLSGIEKESVNSLISESLCIPPSLCQSLSATVHSKTGGLILFVTTFLLSLHEEGMIRFNLGTRKWEYNINEIKQRKLPADVVQYLSERMTRLPSKIQSLLKFAACLGFEFDIDLLQKAVRVPMMKLVPCVIEGGFLHEIASSNKLVWAHDQIHLAAYELIPLDKRSSSHLLIGSRIYMNTSSDEILHRVIFDIVNNMNGGLQLITTQAQRNEVAQLNRIAGNKATSHASFDNAAEYFMVGIRLLAEDCWKVNYEETLILHQEASEALFVAGDFANLKSLIDQQLAHANCLDDKLQAHYCFVRFLYATSNVKQAMEKTRFILEELGVNFPEATPDLIYKELLATKALIINLSREDILNAPRLEDNRIRWTIRFMQGYLKYLLSTTPCVTPLVACRIISMSFDYGYSCDSAAGFIAYGWAQLNILQDIEEAYKWAKLCVSFPHIFGRPALLPKVKCYFHTFTSFWKEPIQASCDELRRCHRDLLMVGDVEVALVALFNHCRQMLFTGIDLAAVEKHCASVTSEMTKLTQFQSYLSHSSHHLLILKLVGQSNDSTKNPFEALKGVLNGEISNEEDLLEHTVSTGKAGVAQAIHFNRLFLAYWFKRYEEAAEMATLYKSRTMMPLIDIYHAFYEGLTAFYFSRQSCSGETEKWFQIGEKSLTCFKTWAMHSTWNWSNKLMLLEAEYHFSKGELEKAEEKYNFAIKSAQQHRFVHEEGLANELLSVFYSSNGDSFKANNHISEARVCYKKWGAFAIVELLDASGE